MERGHRGISLGEIKRLLEVYTAATGAPALTYQDVTNPVIAPDEEWVARGEKPPERGNPRWRDQAP